MNMQYSNHGEWDEAAPVNLENCHEILLQLDGMLEEEKRLEKICAVIRPQGLQ